MTEPNHTSRRLALLLVLLTIAVPVSMRADDKESQPDRVQREEAELAAMFSERIKKLTAQIDKTPTAVELYSRRADAYFFNSEFAKALADYDKMVDLDSSTDAQHWRRGIADFYAGKFEAAAKQFERYHTTDMKDRENGIWRYLSQVKAYGREKARKELLKYEIEDREPFPAVYQLFAGKLTPDAILKQIQDAKISDDDRQARLFYAELYIGLNYDVENEPQKALEHLQRARAAEWPRSAGYGPNYMWHVGRVHALALEKKLKGKP